MIMWICLALLAIGGIAAVIVGDAGPIDGISGDAIAGVAASLALLIFLGSSFIDKSRVNIKRLVRDIAIWTGIMLFVVVLYTFRNDAAMVFNRVAAELMPPGQNISIGTVAGSEHVVRVRKRRDSHFGVQARINSVRTRMLVDTGASTIVLTARDAKAIGINIDRLVFAVPVNTANGATYAAAVQLNEIQIGSIAIRNLEALVSKPGALKESLLGMNFLRRLRSYEFTGDFLTLRG